MHSYRPHANFKVEVMQNMSNHTNCMCYSLAIKKQSCDLFVFVIKSFKLSSYAYIVKIYFECFFYYLFYIDLIINFIFGC